MTLIDWLREQARAADGPPKFHKAWRAADRIERLEEWDRKRQEDIMTLGAVVGRLEAALREICLTYNEKPDATLMAFIARRALEGKE